MRKTAREWECDKTEKQLGGGKKQWSTFEQSLLIYSVLQKK